MRRPSFARYACATGLFAIAALHCGSAQAQVNTEPLRKKLKVSGWTVSIQGSLDAREGNSTGVDASTGGGTGFQTGRHMAFIFGTAEFARYNNVTSIDNTFVHARYNYEFLPWLWGEAYAQLQSDHFQRILLRDLVGLGPRVALYQSKDLDVYFGTGWMVEHDAIDVLPGSNDRADFYAHRWTNYLSLNYQLDTRVTFASALYAQPRFNDFADLRVLEETALIFKITKVLSAAITGTYHYDSLPPTGVKTTDIDVKNVLSVTF